MARGDIEVHVKGPTPLEIRAYTRELQRLERAVEALKRLGVKVELELKARD